MSHQETRELLRPRYQTTSNNVKSHPTQTSKNELQHVFKMSAVCLQRVFSVSSNTCDKRALHHVLQVVLRSLQVKAMRDI